MQKLAAAKAKKNDEKNLEMKDIKEKFTQHIQKLVGGIPEAENSYEFNHDDDNDKRIMKAI